MTNRTISRSMEQRILHALKPGHVVALLGARRVGKTFLMEQVKSRISGKKILTVQGDNLDTAEILSSGRLSLIERFIQGYNALFVDEAQMIPNIGQNIKLLVDSNPEIIVFITGSSAFDLKSRTGGHLTGRSTFYNLFPLAQMELNEDFLKVRNMLEQKLIFGLYPQVFLSTNDEEKIDTLESIRDGYLLKDLLLTDSYKGTLFVINLLRLLAFQIGNEVSFSELGRALNADNKTIQRYLELLEKMFVIFSLNGFSRNLRKEYTKSPRYYFWDNGIRNALISNYNRFNQRDDVGKLWENYCISERMKRNHYQRKRVNSFFWRTYDQKEIDYVEESGGQLFGYEMKWGRSRSSGEKLFSTIYSNALVKTINPENHLDFIG